MNALIIDSHPLFQKAISKSITELRQDVFIETRFEAIHSNDISWDLVIFGINGDQDKSYSFLKCFMQRAVKYPVVVMINESGFNEYSQLLDLGVRDIIPKVACEYDFVDALKKYTHPNRVDTNEHCLIFKEIEKKYWQREKQIKYLRLTSRQLEVLNLLKYRYNIEEISEKLSISVSTVKSHINKIYSALDVSTRRLCVEKCYNLGLFFSSEEIAEKSYE